MVVLCNKIVQTISMILNVIQYFHNLFQVSSKSKQLIISSFP